MTSPPRIATFVLNRLGPQNDVLVGDLAEEYSRRQSKWWYWRQVLIAVALHLATDVRGHRLIALRGIVTGVLLLLALEWIIAPIGAGFNRWLLRFPFGLVMMTTIPSRFFFYWMLRFWTAVVAGWVVARLHPRQRAIAVLGIVLTVGLMAIFTERFYFLVRNSLTHERFVPYLLTYLFGHAVGMAGVLVGGLMAPTTAGRVASKA